MAQRFSRIDTKFCLRRIFSKKMILPSANLLFCLIRATSGQKSEKMKLNRSKPNCGQRINGHLLFMRKKRHEFGQRRQHIHHDIFKHVRRHPRIGLGQNNLERLFTETGDVRRTPQFPAFPEHGSIRLKRARTQSGHRPEIDSAWWPTQMSLQILEYVTTAGIGLTTKVQTEFHVGHDHLGRRLGVFKKTGPGLGEFTPLAGRHLGVLRNGRGGGGM